MSLPHATVIGGTGYKRSSVLELSVGLSMEGAAYLLI